MTGIWTAAALIIGVLAMAVAAVSIFVLLRVQRTVLDRQRAVEGQVNTIATAVRMIEVRLAEAAGGSGDAPNEEGPGSVIEPGIVPEIQAAIAAAAIAAVGPNAQVRSARLVKSPDTNAWSQQGRVLVQSSHNPRQ